MILKIMITDYGRIDILNKKIEEKFINNCKKEELYEIYINIYQLIIDIF